MQSNSNIKILLVEDEREIRELIAMVLTRAQYSIQAVESAEAARDLLDREKFDLLVLDWMLPKENGIDLISHIRSQKGQPQPAILLVTARAEPEDIVLGLDRGADDYVTKPFDIRVLVARVEALLRRAKAPTSPEPQEKVTFGDVFIDHGKMEVCFQGRPVELTHTEFRLLWVLISSPHIVLTREKILQQIQGTDVNVIGRTVDTHIFALRKKLAPWSDCIATVRGVGYRFSPE